jgi:hypothetical protein
VIDTGSVVTLVDGSPTTCTMYRYTHDRAVKFENPNVWTSSTKLMKIKRIFLKFEVKMCDSHSICIGLDWPWPVITIKAHIRTAITLWSCETIKKQYIFKYLKMQICLHHVVLDHTLFLFFFICRDKQDGYCQPRNFLSPECPKLSAWTEKMSAWTEKCFILRKLLKHLDNMFLHH